MHVSYSGSMCPIAARYISVLQCNRNVLLFFFLFFFYILLIYFCKQQIILYILGRICPTSHFSGDIFVDSILVGY